MRSIAIASLCALTPVDGHKGRRRNTYSGKFKTHEDYTFTNDEGVKGDAELTILKNGKTKVEINIRGLRGSAALPYMAHLHTMPCDEGEPKAGPHYVQPNVLCNEPGGCTSINNTPYNFGALLDEEVAHLNSLWWSMFSLENLGGFYENPFGTTNVSFSTKLETEVDFEVDVEHTRSIVIHDPNNDNDRMMCATLKRRRR